MVFNIECDDVDIVDLFDDIYGFDFFVIGMNVQGVGWMVLSNGVNIVVGIYGQMICVEGLFIVDGDVILIIIDL